MTSPNSLHWLASYPKSGNTWLRAFLGNYLLNSETPLSINQLAGFGASDGDVRPYAMVSEGAFDPKDAKSVIARRTRALERIRDAGGAITLIKTHCFNSTVDGVALIPPQLTRGAVYVVRHPGDVAVSFASQYGLSIDDALARMSAREAVVSGATTAVQFTSDWNSHVISWTNQQAFPVLVLRYEDMHTDPVKAFGNVLRTIGVKVNRRRLDRAIAHAAFDELRGQEQQDGFNENPASQAAFFRNGEPGAWTSALGQPQIERLVAAHGPLMKRLGYV